MSTKKQSEPTSRIDFGVLLNLAFGAFKAQLHADLARAGFDDVGSSFGYVFRLLESQELILRDLAEGLRMTSPGALKIVDDMVLKGYLDRVDDPDDARKKWLKLTPRARKAMQVARQFHEAFERALGEHIGQREIKATRSVLEKIVQNARAGKPGGEIALRPL